ncbi:xylulokinase [Blautia marasmi]|uniref:xylulokinase n=1 Tax=Blautia marasmi TaxID=1917868 RepID=UPI00266C84A2|nr:FGGY family carbohydrate kinase [Blautia marasmi]
MDRQLLMAVDLGTSFIKCGVYDTQSNCVVEAMEPVKDERPAPGVFIQKGEDLFASVVHCIKVVSEKLGEQAQDLAAIAFTGQMSGFMGVGKDWEDITTWSCSLDSRYMPYAKRQMQELKDKFLEISGTNFPQMAPKYEWFAAEYPELSEKIEKYVMISGYVIGRLGNLGTEDAVMDRSYASWTGLADIRDNTWSKEICGNIGLDEKFLPKMVGSNTICGYLGKEAARAVGLKSGIPLVSGAGDKVAGCLGAANVEAGDIVFEASSYGEISCCVEDYRPDVQEKRLDILAAAVPGKYYVTHFIAGSGITLDWFVKHFVRKEESLKDAFARIDQAAKAVPAGCDGMMAMGLLGGSSMPLSEDLKGLFMGFDWSHDTEHFYRALLESFSYDFSLALERVDRLYPEYSWDTVKMIGGGAKSALWPAMAADITGKKHGTLDRGDVSMWGACILAGNAVGIFENPEETAKKHVKVSKIYQPSAADCKLYEDRKRLYKAYMQELPAFYKRLEKCS